MLKTLAKLLPLIILFQWDMAIPTDPDIVVQGFRIKASNSVGGTYSTIIQVADPTSRLTIEGTLTSGVTRCYLAVSYGTVSGAPGESAISGELCITNTTDAPLVGPGSSRPGQVIYR